MFATVVAVANISYQLGKLGMDTATVRLLPVYAEQGRLLRQWALARYALTAALCASGLIGLVLLLAAGPLAGLLAPGQPTVALALRVVALSLPVGACNLVLVGLSRGAGRLRPLVLTKNVLEPLLRLLGVVVALALGGGALWAVIAWTVAPVLTTVSLGVAVLRAVRTPRTGAGQPHAFGAADRTELWGFALPRAMSGAVEILGLHAGVLILAVVAGQEAAGVFGVVTRMLAAGALGLNALTLAIAPRFATLDARRQNHELSHLMTVSTGWVVVSSVGVHLVLLAFPGPALDLVGGPGFRVGVVAMVAMTVATVVNLGTGTSQTALLMTGNSAVTLLISAVSLSLNAALTVLLAPRLGVTGAGLAKMAAVLGENLAVILYLRYGCGVRMEASRLVEPVCVATGAAAVGVLGGALLEAGGAGSSVALVGALVLTLAVTAPVAWWRGERLGLGELLPGSRPSEPLEARRA
jgi:O-antigen/teichoic acid export membrane protein